MSPSARQRYRDCLHFQRCALTRKFRVSKVVLAGRYDIDKLVAHLAINRKLARMSVTKALNLNDIFHLPPTLSHRSFQVFVDQCSLLAKIHAASKDDGAREALYASRYCAIATTARVSVLLGCRSSSRIVK